ncbi:uncharacterized protein LOC133893412 [Phragmites australis]|uniref:uncharacterized protein LOC133893412 n=1 Tax=Phragmites australis TaxID=29695 RepID=UPI002D7656B6|nr:uncharacterized protein LOC133893412 [Phragmites australis]
MVAGRRQCATSEDRSDDAPAEQQPPSMRCHCLCSAGEERLIYVLWYLLTGACVLVTNQFSALFFPESFYDLLVLTSIDTHAYLLFVEMPGNLDGTSLPGSDKRQHINSSSFGDLGSAGLMRKDVPHLISAGSLGDLGGAGMLGRDKRHLISGSSLSDLDGASMLDGQLSHRWFNLAHAGQRGNLGGALLGHERF